jgi:uncharacterized protein (TIGR03437 family)
MHTTKLAAALLAGALSLTAQLVPTVRTFLGNGTTPAGAIFNNPSLAGTDVRSWAVRPEGISVDQRGTISLAIGYVIRVTRGGVFLDSLAALGVGPTAVGVSPLGAVAAAGNDRCLFTAPAPAANGGLLFTRLIGNCLAEAADSGDGGPATAARFLSVKAIGVDRQGDVYVYDDDARKVRRIDASGVIRTVATGISLRTSLDYSATLLPAHPAGGVAGVRADDHLPVRIDSGGVTPIAIPDFGGDRVFTWDLDDNLYYFRKSDEALVRRTPNGLVTSIGLNGQMEFTEGMAASDLNQRFVDGIAADTAGNVYVFVRAVGRNVASNPLDFRVLRITLPGVGRSDCSFSVSSNPAPATGGALQIGVTASTAGCYWSVSSADSWLQAAAGVQRGNGTATLTVGPNTGRERSGTVTIGGQAFTISQGAAAGVAAGPGGTISSFAGVAGQVGLTPVTAPTSASAFRFGFVGEMAFDSRGDLFVTDWARYQIFRIAKSDGTVTPVAGVGGSATTPEGYGGPATAARLSSPYALAIDGNDTIYTASRQAIQSFRVGGPLTRVADGTNSLGNVGATYDAAKQRVLFAGGGLFALNGSALTMLSGRSFDPFTEGMALSSLFLSPTGVAADAAGNLYVSGGSVRRVFKVALDGTVTTLAGTGVSGSSGDNGPARAAQLSLPSGIAVDRTGNVYIADTVANRVRRVRPDGIIETVVGTGARGTTGDGGAASAALIDGPSTLALDAEGSLYIGSSSYNIRKVTFPRASATISAGGVVNLSGGALSPGGLFSIYGTNLAGAAQSAGAFPLPTTLGGVSVLVNGVTAPLSYVSPTQINAQMPTGVAAGRATVSVRNASGTTEGVGVDVVSAGPAILEYGSGRAVATAGSGVLNTNDAPAAVGDVVIVYLTGIGAVEPAVAAGAAAPLTTLSRAVLAAEATIGGVPAEIQFLGLAPGFAGLAQANLVVPAVGGGVKPVEIMVNGVRSNAPVVSVRE